MIHELVPDLTHRPARQNCTRNQEQSPVKQTSTRHAAAHAACLPGQAQEPASYAQAAQVVVGLLDVAMLEGAWLHSRAEGKTAPRVSTAGQPKQQGKLQRIEAPQDPSHNAARLSDNTLLPVGGNLKQPTKDAASTLISPVSTSISLLE